MTEAARAGLAAAVALAVLLGVLGLAQWAGRERAPFGDGGFAEVEDAVARAGLRVCSVADEPVGPADRAVASRAYAVAADCPDGAVTVVVDRFATAAGRDAAARRFESLVRPRGHGAVVTLGSATVLVRGGDTGVRDRLGAALRAAGAR
ncbi:hypothetical protein ACI789_16865 [Geodermatophilus sp. SYSU D00965]